MKTALVVVTVISAAAFSVWHWRGKPATPAATDSLVSNRVWIDHLPKSERDMVQVFALVDEHSIGVYQSVSRWRGQYEGFMFERNGEQVRAVFPQTGDKETFKARARKCDDVRGMDFCLEIDGASRGVKRYYSREGWEIDRTVHDTAALERRVDTVEQALDVTE